MRKSIMHPYAPLTIIQGLKHLNSHLHWPTIYGIQVVIIGCIVLAILETVISNSHYRVPQNPI